MPRKTAPSVPPVNPVSVVPHLTPSQKTVILGDQRGAQRSARPTSENRKQASLALSKWMATHIDLFTPDERIGLMDLASAVWRNQRFTITRL